ncbi:MAG: hypothetical protein R2942_16260 [Ignavibacteria bacterium]
MGKQHTVKYMVRFPVSDPSKVETFNVGLSARGVALDSKGNLWVASNFDLDFPWDTSLPDLDNETVPARRREYDGACVR